MEKGSSILRTMGYVATLALHGVVLTSIVFKGKETKDERFLIFQANRPRYLTGWNVFLQTLHAALALLCEYLLFVNSTNKKYALPKALRVIRDKLFTNVVFPGSFLVATIFWTLFTYDREVVYPQFLDEHIPLAYNHILHTAIVPLALWEVATQPRHQPKSHFWNALHIIVHCLAYLSVILYTYYEKGLWLYPFLGVFSPWQFVLVASGIVGMGFFFYFLHWRLVLMVWGATPTTNRTKAKKIS